MKQFSVLIVCVAFVVYAIAAPQGPVEAPAPVPVGGGGTPIIDAIWAPIQAAGNNVNQFFTNIPNQVGSVFNQFNTAATNAIAQPITNFQQLFRPPAAAGTVSQDIVVVQEPVKKKVELEKESE